MEASSDTSKENMSNVEQEISMKKNTNLNDNNKSEAANQNVVDAAHRRLEEEGEEDESKSGMASLRKLLEEDESYIKHKNRTIPIDNKGMFFKDKGFSDWQECFLSAVKDVLTKFHQPSSEDGGALAAYRRLRQRDLKLENQAAYVDENAQAHTVSTFL